MGLVAQQMQLAAGQPGQAPGMAAPGGADPAMAPQAPGGDPSGAPSASNLDPATQAVANLLRESMSSPESQQAITHQLQEGAKDLEMAVAQLAVNLLQSATETAKGMERQIPHEVLGKVSMMVVGKLLDMAKAAQLIGPEVNPKQLAMRALALTVYMYENGKGSVR